LSFQLLNLFLFFYTILATLYRIEQIQFMDGTLWAHEDIIAQATAVTTTDDILYGGLGNDDLKGLERNDTLFGSAGDDTLNGGTDDDNLYGEAGNDLLDGGAAIDDLGWLPKNEGKAYFLGCAA